MSILAPRGQGRSTIAFLAFAMVISTFGAAFLPSSSRVAFADDGVALGDTVILAGPGGQYGILTVAPAGAAMSVDGDPVDGYYPVTFEGIGGWTATGLVEVTGGGGVAAMAAVVGTATVAARVNGGRDGRTRETGNGGVETVSADPIFTDGGVPVTADPAASGADPPQLAPSQ